MAIGRRLLLLLLAACVLDPARAETSTVQDDGGKGLTKQNLVRLVASTGVLFHGGHYAHTMLLVHTLKATAGPLVKSAYQEVAQAYQEAREKTKDVSASEAAKALAVNRGKIHKAHSKVMAARGRYRAGDLSAEAFRDIERTQRQELFQIIQESDALRAVSSRFHATLGALDGDKLKSLASAIYAAITAAVASATSTTAAVAVVGIGIGRQLATSVRGLVLPVIKRLKGLADREIDLLPPTAQKWARAGVTTLAGVLGIACAYFAQKTALAVATIYFASGAILNTAVDIVNNSTIFAKDTPLFSALHVGLAVLGGSSYFLRPRAPPLPLRLVLKPFDILEAYLSALTIAHFRAGKGSFI